MTRPKMATRAGKEQATYRFRITFERIGRRHDVPDLVVQALDGPYLAEYLADQVYDYASEFLGSREYVVTVDLHPREVARVGVGAIDGGRFGRFTVQQIS